VTETRPFIAGADDVLEKATSGIDGDSRAKASLLEMLVRYKALASRYKMSRTVAMFDRMQALATSESKSKAMPQIANFDLPPNEPWWSTNFIDWYLTASAYIMFRHARLLRDSISEVCPKSRGVSVLVDERRSGIGTFVRTGHSATCSPGTRFRRPSSKVVASRPERCAWSDHALVLRSYTSEWLRFLETSQGTIEPGSAPNRI
jgi:hypothetical protein